MLADEAFWRYDLVVIVSFFNLEMTSGWFCRRDEKFCFKSVENLIRWYNVYDIKG